MAEAVKTSPSAAWMYASLCQLGGRSIGVCLAALSALGIIERQFGNHACLVASLNLGRAAGLRSQKLAVRPRHLEQHLVTNRDGGELTLANCLFARQVGKDPLPDILRQIDARDCHRARTDGVVPAPM